MKFLLMALIFEITAGLFLQSCASTAKFRGEGDFCGMVVDENNRAVSGYVVVCKKAGIPCASALTNESGIFLIQNLKCGRYSFDGRKVNYTDFKDLEIDFNDRKGGMLCCKVFSANALFDRVDKLIEAKDYVEARRNLRFLRHEAGSYVEKMTVVYRGWISVLEKDRKSAEVDIKRLKKFKETEFGDFAMKLEAALNDL